MNILYQLPVLTAIVEADLTLSDLLRFSFTCNTFVINPDVLLQLISQLKTVNSNTLIKCIKKSDINLVIVKGLLKNPRVDPSADDNYAIRLASENGHLPVVERLLEDLRVDPTTGDNYAIWSASQNGHLKVVKLLLADRRVDPSADDNYAIRSASENGHLEVVELLLEDPRVDPSVYDNSALRSASEYGHLEVVDLLLSKMTVVNKLNYATDLNDINMIKKYAKEFLETYPDS